MQNTVCPTTVVALLPLAMLALLALAAVACGVALLAALLRRQGHERRQSERISREREHIVAMAAAGRISAEEASELRMALDDASPVGPEGPMQGRLQKTARPILFGVCGGLAEWLRWDATLVRLAYTLATILVAGFPGVIVYVILALVMPAPEGGATGSKARGIILGLLAAAAILAALLMLLCIGAIVVRAIASFGGVPAVQRLH